VPADQLLSTAMAEAARLGALPAGAFAGNKRQLRRPTADLIAPTVKL